MVADEDFISGTEVGEKLLQSVQQMNAKLGRVVYSRVIAARQASGMSQAAFARLMGVSVRTLQDWEQGRRKPSGAAQTLLQLAESKPQILRELALNELKRAEAHCGK